MSTQRRVGLNSLLEEFDWEPIVQEQVCNVLKVESQRGSEDMGQCGSRPPICVRVLRPLVPVFLRITEFWTFRDVIKIVIYLG